jgi:hypothetical protein
MPIIGESFEKYVNQQIEVRQKIYGSKNRTPQELVYLNGRTAWVRLISSVNIENNPEGTNNEGDKKLEALNLSSAYKDSTLAESLILFAGTSQNSEFSSNPSVRNLRRGINTDTNISIPDTSYGVGTFENGINEYGIQPMPTLGDVEIKYKNRGSLREANLTIKCFNPQQFQMIDTLYLHLGYTVLLEWGNSSYFDNNGEFVSNNSVSMQSEMFDPEFKGDHFQILDTILKKRDQSSGNYDAFFGKISNYNWSFDNGVYNISLKLISLGDVLESLNMNYLSSGVDLIQQNEEELLEEKTIRSERDKNDLARLFYYAKKNSKIPSEQEKQTQKLLGADFTTSEDFVERSKKDSWYAATVGNRGLK